MKLAWRQSEREEMHGTDVNGRAWNGGALHSEAWICVTERTTTMTKGRALKDEIEKLSSAELAELREWIVEREADVWDREIERDAASGKLDKLFEKSVADHRAGKSREI
jgi:hypothetical protein